MQRREIWIAIVWALALAGCAAASFFLLDRQTLEPVYWLSQMPPVYTAVEYLTTFGKAGFPILAFSALWLWGFLRRSGGLKQSAMLGIAAQVATGAIVWALKLSITRERPYVPYHLKGEIATGYYQSFPSGDAGAIFALAFAASHAFPRARPALMAFAAAVAAMRVFRLAHYPSDVFAGAAAAAAGWAVTLATFNWLDERKREPSSDR
ncbi:MAG: hypothetical protein KatS3mg024_1676 [Armatimonadota bacterium]|nr:MAG: hypothetical protein KatS3mg024_1676 [Armatimonadota bacterium]